MEKVLVVEDNQDLGSLLKERLEYNGFSVDIVESGYSLLSYLMSASPPDIVILDLMLPEKTGMELLSGLRCKCPKAKIFIFSGYLEYKSRLYPVDADYIEGFFCKSDGTEQLIEAIKNHRK